MLLNLIYPTYWQCMSSTGMNEICITSWDYFQLHEYLNSQESYCRRGNPLKFIINVFTTSEERYLFWGSTSIAMTSNSESLEFNRSFLNLLKSNWGDFRFFILEIEDCPCGIFAIYNVSMSNQRAELLVWIESRYRRKNLLIKWWIIFLVNIQKIGIRQLFAKIREQNLVAIKAAHGYGFEQCGLLPQYFKNPETSESAYIFTRSTELNKFELLYARRRNLVLS